MNKELFVFVFMLVFSCLSWSQNILVDTSINSIDDTEQVFLWYSDIYSLSPSLLSSWNPGNRSYLNFEYNNDKGDFHHPQSYSRLSSFNFKTESFFRKENSLWSFYGMFAYSNSRADSVRSNLSYDIGQDGSPYYYFIKRAGNWNLQYYSFDAVASRRINSKLSLAGNIKYNGRQFFRLVDTRNNQTKLGIGLKLSVTYNINDQNYLNMAVEYTYNKTEHSFSNIYQHSSDGLLYNIYLNAGMGTYFKGADFPSSIGYHIPGITIQWIQHLDKKTTSIAYSFNKGKQEWKDKSIVRIDKQNIITKYNTGKHKLKVQTIKGLSQSTVDVALNVGLTMGKGYQLNKTISRYIQNYNYTDIDALFKAQINRDNHALDKIMFRVRLNHTKQRDKNYAYLLMYSNADLYAGARFNFRVMKNNTFIELKPGYHKNIRFDNNKGAASENIYTSWIGEPVSEFFSSDWFYVASTIGMQNLINELPVKLQLHLNYTKPTNINETNLSDNRIDDYFLEIECGVKIYF